MSSLPIWKQPNEFFVEFILITLIIFSPLFNGGLPNLALSVIETLCLLAFLIFCSHLLLQETLSLAKIPYLVISLFISLCFFQIIPLPATLISILSPGADNLYREFRINYPAWLTLSIYPESTIYMLLQAVSFTALFFVVLNYVDTENKARRLLLAIIISGFLYSFYGIVRLLTYSFQNFSTFMNRNHFAAYIEMIILLGIGYSMLDAPRAKRTIFVFATSVMILALFLSLSRAGRMSFLFSLLLFLLLLHKKIPIKKIIVVLVVLVLFITIFIGFIGFDPVLKRLDTLRDPFLAYNHRGQLSKATFRIFTDFPFLGTGLGTFNDIYLKFQTFNWQKVGKAHSLNDALQLLSETGIIGFSLILLFLFLYLKRVFILWKSRTSNFPVFITLGCFLGLLSIILHSCFEFIFSVPANALLFLIILALMYKIVHLKKPQDLLPIPKFTIILQHNFRIISIIVLTLLFVFTNVLVWNRYQAEARFERINQQKISNVGIHAIVAYEDAINEINKAIAVNHNNSKYLSKKADLLMELALRNDLKDEFRVFKEFKEPAQALDIARTLYEKAIDLNPTNFDYHLKLARLYSILGEKDLRQQEYKKALFLNPQNTKIKAYFKSSSE